LSAELGDRKKQDALKAVRDYLDYGPEGDDDSQYAVSYDRCLLPAAALCSATALWSKG